MCFTIIYVYGDIKKVNHYANFRIVLHAFAEKDPFTDLNIYFYASLPILLMYFSYF